jgi:predicted MPP superfamily phosphohydrolase
MNLFFLTFISVYSALHLYMFFKIKSAITLGTGVTICIVLFMAVMISAPFLVRVSERYALESFARLLSYVGYTWLGLIFLFCISSVLIDLYRLVIATGGMVLPLNLSSLIPSPRLAFFIPALLTAAVASYGFFEARFIRCERVTIMSPKIPRKVGTLTICQISDVHLGLIVREGRLKKILKEVKQAQPDILVSTGDLVDGQIDNLGQLAVLLRAINPPYGKFAVTGNHEFYAGLDHALQFTKEAGFTVLRGEARTVDGCMTIVGVDDPTGRRFGLFRGPAEKDLLAGLPSGRFTLLLKHPPVVDEEALGLFDLQLSGHTHKGQIFPFNYASKIFFPYDAGLIHLPRHSSLYVSRGSGTWGPPIRFLAPPEVTVITLVHADE